MRRLGRRRIVSLVPSRHDHWSISCSLCHLIVFSSASAWGFSVQLSSATARLMTRNLRRHMVPLYLYMSIQRAPRCRHNTIKPCRSLKAVNWPLGNMLEPRSRRTVSASDHPWGSCPMSQLLRGSLGFPRGGTNWTKIIQRTRNICIIAVYVGCNS